MSTFERILSLILNRQKKKKKAGKRLVERWEGEDVELGTGREGRSLKQSET